MRVSVRASALACSGYRSLVDGLAELDLRWLDIDVTPSGAVPRLDVPGWPTVSIAHESAARAYRERLYEHRVSVSALYAECPSIEEEPRTVAQDLQTIVQAADVLGASVVCVQVPAPSQDKLLPAVRRAAELVIGMRAGLALIFPTEGGALDPTEWIDLDGVTAPGIGLELETLFGLAPTVECAYDLLRFLSPYVRCVVCRYAFLHHYPGSSLVSPCHGAPDYARVVAILGNAGYHGTLTAALPSGITGQDARSLLIAQVGYLRDIVGES